MGATKKIPNQHRLSAANPNRKTNAETASPTHHPMTSRLKKKAASGKPSENTQTSNNGKARKAAGVAAIRVRRKLMNVRAPISSIGRKGETKSCPRFRDHISSINDNATPKLDRNRISQRSTALIRTPAADRPGMGQGARR